MPVDLVHQAFREAKAVLELPFDQIDEADWERYEAVVQVLYVQAFLPACELWTLPPDHWLVSQQPGTGTQVDLAISVQIVWYLG